MRYLLIILLLLLVGCSMIPRKFYYDNGEVRTKGKMKGGQYGIRYGKWIEYDKSGYISASGSYENGHKVGEWLEYNKDGNITARGFYVNSKKQGEWYYFDTNDNNTEKINFIDGFRVYNESIFVDSLYNDLQKNIKAS